MGNKKGTKAVGEMEFSKIKLMQEAGMNALQVAKTTKRSYNTVRKVFDNDTYNSMRGKATSSKKSGYDARYAELEGRITSLEFDVVKLKQEEAGKTSKDNGAWLNRVIRKRTV